MMCGFCHTYSRADRVFCLNCNRRLLPPSSFALTADDFTSPGDKSSLDALRGTEPLPHVIERLVTRGDRSESWLARHGARLRQHSSLDTLIRACGEVLGLERLPKTYVVPIPQVNAFTTGTDADPLLVICSPVLRTLKYAEMEGLIAHELAHVRSRHVLYHTLAESIASGVQFAAPFFGAGLVTLPIRMLLLSWYRESEISADRAALLVVGDYHIFESLMVDLLRYGSGARGGHETGSIGELLQTHPTIGRRLRLAREYAVSVEHGRAREKAIAAAKFQALASTCRYCGMMVPRSESFCPNCGLGQA